MDSMQIASIKVKYGRQICLFLWTHQGCGLQAAMHTLESERAALEEQLAAAQVDSCFSVCHCIIITRLYMQI